VAGQFARATKMIIVDMIFELTLVKFIFGFFFTNLISGLKHFFSKNRYEVSL
jgi:hypothetical protein